MMPSPFAITVVPTSLTVEAGKVGQLEVTVSNRAGQPLTARATRVVEPKTAQDWLKPRDKEEAPLAPGATQTFVFDVKVPAGSAAQTVKVRVDFSDVTDPDRFFAQGQTVAVTVPVPPPPPNGKPKWWIYAVAAVVVLLAAGGIYLALKPAKLVRVPPVAGMFLQVAYKSLRDSGFVVENVNVALTRSLVDNGKVRSVDEPKDSMVKRGTPVTITVWTYSPLAVFQDSLAAVGRWRGVIGLPLHH